jgi:hypothetical protein
MEISSTFYYHCDRFIKSAQFVKFLDALEHSGILDPSLQISPVSDDGVEILPLERTHISIFDLARIFHDKTELPGHWAIFRQALQLNAGEWAQLNHMFNVQQSPLEVIKFAFDAWSGRLS